LNTPRVYCPSYKLHSFKAHINRETSGEYGLKNQEADREVWEFQMWWTAGFNRPRCKYWSRSLNQPSTQVVTDFVQAAVPTLLLLKQKNTSRQDTEFW